MCYDGKCDGKYDGKLKSYNSISLGLVFSGNKQESFQQKFMLVLKIEKISDIFLTFKCLYILFLKIFKDQRS